jgi:hypothetical protein
MPSQVIEGTAAKTGKKPWPETHTKQGMSDDPRDTQGYLKAKERFPKLSFDTYCKKSCFFDDEYIQASLPNQDVVREYLDNYNWSVYKGTYEELQNADRKRRLHELIERGPVDAGAKGLVVWYIGGYLLLTSSAAAVRQAFLPNHLYEEAIRPLLEKYPELVRSATIRLATTFVEDISSGLRDKDGPLLLSNFCSLECPKFRYLIDDPELSRFLPADQLEVVKKTLEEATELYNDDPDLCDYLAAAYDRLVMQDYENYEDQVK